MGAAFWASYAILWFIVLSLVLLVAALLKVNGRMLIQQKTDTTQPFVGEAIRPHEVVAEDGRRLVVGRGHEVPQVIAIVAPGCPQCARLIAGFREFLTSNTSVDGVLLVAGKALEGEAQSALSALQQALATPVVVDQRASMVIGWGFRRVPFAVVIDESSTVLAEGSPISADAFAELLQQAREYKPQRGATVMGGG